jgi:hypothetical protein
MIWTADIASQTGIAKGAIGARPSLSTFVATRPGDNGPEPAFGRMTAWLAGSLAVAARYGELPIAVWTELPIRPGAMQGRTNSKTIRLLTGLWACVTGVVLARGIPCHTVDVATVRAAVLGDGRIGGAEAKRRAFRLCRAAGLDPQNDDESDAYAVWLFASTLYRAQEPGRCSGAGVKVR